MDELELTILHLKQARENLEDNLIDNIITIKDYNLTLVNIAYSFALNGLLDDFLLTFIDLPENYFENDGLIEIQDNPELYHKCSFLLEIFRYMGLVPSGILGTQPLAKA